MQNAPRDPSTTGAAVSVGLSLLAALAFMGLATLTGETSWAGRLVGAVWVFLLTAIILMPVIVPRVRARAGRR